jgi:hypothetical protein
MVPGDSYRMFLQTTDGAPDALLRATLPAMPDVSALSYAGDTALAGQGSYIFVPTTSVPTPVRVDGFNPASGSIVVATASSCTTSMSCRSWYPLR